MTLSLDLEGRVALVTGGARGIGAGITQVLLAAGAQVVTCGRSEATAPQGATYRVCDVRDAAAVEELVAGVVAEHGRLDVLVNNAGGAPHADAATASPRFHEKIVSLNFLSPLLVSQVANRVMQEQSEGGVIVNISSIAARRPSPGTAAYGASKAGLSVLTESLAQEWGPRVRVNAVEVGLVRTPDTVDHYGDGATVAAIEATIPAGRMADVTEIGTTVAFLASDLASYISGASISCHGGGEQPVFGYIMHRAQSQES
ncbi:MAG: SDR family oxidoreductase [Nocardioidaceae bacterium]|nr:SDR family oxidoreductase [Nocardioidaceae bacterium]